MTVSKHNNLNILEASVDNCIFDCVYKNIIAKTVLRSQYMEGRCCIGRICLQEVISKTIYLNTFHNIRQLQHFFHYLCVV